MFKCVYREDIDFCTIIRHIHIYDKCHANPIITDCWMMNNKWFDPLTRVPSSGKLYIIFIVRGPVEQLTGPRMASWQNLTFPVLTPTAL